jgi:hypothetical protein
MHQTIHQPLRIHLQLASVAKTPKSLCGIDVAKDGLNCAQAAAINMPAVIAIGFSLHLVDDGR